MEKKVDSNYRRMLRAVLNKSWRHHPPPQKKQQLYGHQPPVSKTIQIRRTKRRWRNKYELINDEMLWIPSHRRARVGQPAKTYLPQPCTDTECSLEDLPGAMDDRDEWWERVREISMLTARHDDDIYIYIYIYIYISNLLLWTPAHGCDSISWPAKTCISSIRTQDAGWKTGQMGWMARERERERVWELLLYNIWHGF